MKYVLTACVCSPVSPAESVQATRYAHLGFVRLAADQMITHALTCAARKVLVDPMLCVILSTKMSIALVQQDLLVCQLPNRAVLGYHLDVEMEQMSKNVHQSTLAKVACVISNARAMEIVPTVKSVKMESV